MESKLFKFPSSGIEIKVRKVSPLILADMSLANTEPTPPVQEIEIDGKIVREENLAHPDYLKALNDYRREAQRMTQRTIVRLGVDYRLSETDLADLKRITDFMRENNAEPQGQSDLEQWIYYVAVQSPDDLSALTEEVLSLSGPTPKSD